MLRSRRATSKWVLRSAGATLSGYKRERSRGRELDAIRALTCLATGGGRPVLEAERFLDATRALTCLATRFVATSCL